MYNMSMPSKPPDEQLEDALAEMDRFVRTLDLPPEQFSDLLSKLSSICHAGLYAITDVLNPQTAATQEEAIKASHDVYDRWSFDKWGIEAGKVGWHAQNDKSASNEALLGS